MDTLGRGDFAGTESASTPVVINTRGFLKMARGVGMVQWSTNN